MDPIDDDAGRMEEIAPAVDGKAQIAIKADRAVVSLIQGLEQIDSLGNQ